MSSFGENSSEGIRQQKWEDQLARIPTPIKGNQIYLDLENARTKNESKGFTSLESPQFPIFTAIVDTIDKELEDDWAIEIGTLGEEIDSRLTTLSLYATHPTLDGLSMNGEYGKSIFKAYSDLSPIKPGAQGKTPKFGQEERASILEPLFDGTNFIPLSINDRPVELKIPLSPRRGIFGQNKPEYVNAFQKGVRKIILHLCTIQEAVDRVDKEIVRLQDIQYQGGEQDNIDRSRFELRVSQIRKKELQSKLVETPSLLFLNQQHLKK